ncbi:uncharacterized protein LOC111693959 [Trichogramma pretiosum]|uniref:uncharacterized protein LOC111693959 n=1 Tax=Trichogramma pretiosum TaxID=7493 RepID=UPI000C71986F|nr:uncharacterized protein LOC111693959 [Trichogramma pretiosum]
MIERLHRQLKSALIAQSNSDWVSCLPFVLLGIRSSFKEDIKSTAAELVYGESLRLPSEFFCSDSRSSRSSNYQDFLADIRKYISDLRPSPASRHGNPSIFVFKELKDCSHAYLKDCRFLKALEPPYLGPFEIIERDDKLVTLKINNSPTKVFIDRVKPAFLFNSSITFSVHDVFSVPVPASTPDPVHSVKNRLSFTEP